MEYISLIVAFAALGFSVFTFSIHQRMLSKLRHRLDEAYLTEGARDILAQKKAFLIAFISRTNDPNKIQLNIRNDGFATARNIRFKFNHPQTGQDVGETMLISAASSPEIPADEYIVINLTFTEKTPKVSHIRLYWDDEYKQGNRRKALLHLRS
ncbi:MAG: hypothetical protein ACRC9P_04700 [Bacteroides sp.]